MRKYLGFGLVLLALITLLIWGVDKFVHHILPSNISDEIMLFFATFAVVTGILSGVKDFIELLRELFDYKHNEDGASDFKKNSQGSYFPPVQNSSRTNSFQKEQAGVPAIDSYINLSADGNISAHVASDEGSMSSATIESIQIGDGSFDDDSFEVTREVHRSNKTIDVYRETHQGPKYKDQDYKKHSGTVDHRRI